MRRITLPVVGLGLISFIAGCETVREAGEISVVTPGSLEKRFFGDYWEVKDLTSPRESGVQTIAVTEFTLEFVTEKTRNFPDNLGVTQRKCRYEEDLFRRLPNHLYQVFADRVNSLGSEERVVPISTVSGSASYGRYESSPPPGFPEVRHVTPIPSDTGKIGTVRIYTADGLKYITGGRTETGQAEDVDLEVLAEVGADLAIRARFRIGVHRGRATVEEGSTLTVTGKNIRGSLKSKRSLSTHRTVLADGTYLPTVTGVYEVDTRRYMKAIDQAFLRYVDLGVEAIRSQ